MLQNNSLRKDIRSYSILFIIAALGCYAFFIISGTTLVKYCNSNADGLTQTYTSYVAIRRMLQDWFAGKGVSAWSWSIGLGADTFEYFGFKLFNPLTYLIVAFPENLIDVGYSIATVLREYLAGLAFLLCMREVKLTSCQCIVGALTYAFSGWMVEVAFNQGSFENAAIIFPLLIMGAEKFFKKKSPALFIISVVLCLTTGITWTYISGIVVVVYFFVRYHDYYGGESIGTFFKTFGEYVLYGIIGIMISAPFMLSILCGLSGATTDTGAVTRNWTYSLSKYLTIPEGLFKYTEVGATSYSYIYVSVVCVALLPMLIYRLKKRDTIAWIATVLATLSLIPATSKFFNGMSYAAGRWYYVLTFFVIWATVSCLNEEILSSRKNIAIIGGWLNVLLILVVGIYLLGYGSKSGVLATAIGYMFGLVLIAIAYMYYYQKKENQMLVIVAALVLVVSIMVPACGKSCPAVSDYLGKYLKIGESYDKLLSTPERVVSEIDDNTFFRSDQAYRVNTEMHTKLKTNANVVYGNNSVYTYCSLVDAKWNLFNKCVGNNSGYFSRITVAGNDDRPILDYLLGVKYYLGNNEYEENASDYAGYGYEQADHIDGVDILKKSNCIGLGTAIPKYITESELMEYPTLVRDQVMLQAVVIPDDKLESVEGVQHASKKDISTEIDDLNIKIKAGKKTTVDKAAKTITTTKSKAHFDIKIASEPGAQIVVSLQGLKRNPDTKDNQFKITAESKNTTKYAYCEQNSPRGFNDITEYNLNMGRSEVVGNKIRLTLKGSGTYTYDAIKVYAIPMTVLENNQEDLETHSYKIATYDRYHGDHIEGTVKADEQSVLYLSFPYDKGWKAYIDGEKTDMLPTVDVGFTGVVVPAGEHSVVLSYSHWGMKAAIICTIIGILGFILIIYWRRKFNVQAK